MLVIALPPDVAASSFTGRWFAGLPEFMQTADRAGGFPLLRFMRGLGDQADDVVQLLARIDVDDATPGDTSDLLDPDRGDPAWLPFMAALVGAQLAPGLSVEQQRDAVRYAPSGFRAGKKAAVADAARAALTGTRYARVVPQRTESGPGSMWDLLVITRLTETPNVPAVLAAVEAQRVKPAGTVLHHLAYSATTAQVEAAYPTAGSYTGKTTAQIEEAGLGVS